MVRMLRLLAGIALLVATSAGVAYTPGAGIAGTPHDWSGVNATKLLLWVDARGGVTTYNTGTPYLDPATGKQGVTTVTIGQCTKCRTPHQAKSVSLAWNHTLQAISHRWDSPATTAGTPYATFRGDSYKGPTTKCLSCHDGLLASTDGMWLNRAVTSGIRVAVAAGSFNDGHDVADGPNLSKSHPVAMPYPLNGTPNTYNFVRNGAQITATEWVPIRRRRSTFGSTVMTAQATSSPALFRQDRHRVLVVPRRTRDGPRVHGIPASAGQAHGKDQGPTATFALSATRSSRVGTTRPRPLATSSHVGTATFEPRQIIISPTRTRGRR